MKNAPNRRWADLIRLYEEVSKLPHSQIKLKFSGNVGRKRSWDIGGEVDADLTNVSGSVDGGIDTDVDMDFSYEFEVTDVTS